MGYRLEPRVRQLCGRSRAQLGDRVGVVDNLGKGTAGQAVQNANLICGLPETAGLDGVPVWP
jgi:N-acetyl-gamma-glutamylphosphate reductase